MIELLIISDDLSGAADSAAGCLPAGLDATVILEPAEGKSDTHLAQVVAVDADTRRSAAGESAMAHAHIYHQYANGSTFLYKKLDSTLRGNVAAELEALCRCAGMAILAPAFPDAGRLTRDGRQWVHGIPLEQTEIWKSEHRQHPASISGLLTQGGLRSEHLPLSMLHSGLDAVRQHIERCIQSGVQVLICDAHSNEDLGLIAQASISLSARLFWAGSAGLIQQLAPIVRLRQLNRRRLPLAFTGSILTVVGSAAGASRGQLAQLRSTRDVIEIDIQAEMLKAGESHKNWSSTQAQFARSLQEGDVALGVTEDGAQDLSDGLRLCQALGRLLAPQSSNIGALIATGGETARALLSSLAISEFHIAAEVEPGVPQSWATSPRSMPIITKAGAFGTPLTLLKCYDHLQRLRSLPNSPNAR